MPAANGQLRGRLYIIAAALLWSTGGLFMKVLLAPPYEVGFEALCCLRSLAAGLALCWALPRLKGIQPRAIAPATISYVVLIYTFVGANAFTTAANAILLQHFYPMIVAVGTVMLYRERLSRHNSIALVIGMAGVTVIAGGSIGGAETLGVTMGLISAFAFGAFVLLQRHVDQSRPVAMTCLYNLVTAAAVLPLAWGELSVSPGALLLIAVQGVVQIALPYVLFLKGLQTVTGPTASIITLAEAVLNPVWVAVGVGEWPNRWTILGGVAILAALIVQLRAPKKAAAKK